MTFRGPSRRGVAALGALLLAAVTVPAVAATPSALSKCSDAIAAANLRNDAGDYVGALAAFDSIVPTCKGKGDRIGIQSGRAHALNRQKKYADAITAADAVLKDDKTHLFALFERAYANEHLGNKELASADYQQVITLTEKNQNVKERATLYAKMADLNYNAGKTAEAEAALAKAVELDPANPSFAIMKGDWAVKAGNYAAADSAYNKATAMGVSGAEMYQIRSEASLKMVQEKYGTTNAQELRSKMTAQEKALVCTDLNRALALGWKNPQMDMFAALTCR
jgi:tetratricopeptide (TPR) repeat protein